MLSSAWHSCDWGRGLLFIMKDRGHASNSAQVASEQEVFISTETTTTEMVSYWYTVNVMNVKYTKYSAPEMIL